MFSILSFYRIENRRGCSFDSSRERERIAEALAVEETAEGLFLHSPRPPRARAARVTEPRVASRAERQPRDEVFLPFAGEFLRSICPPLRPCRAVP